MRVKPVPGRLVRDPIKRTPISEETAVPDIPYWRRRINEGDLVEVLPAAKPKQEVTK